MDEHVKRQISELRGAIRELRILAQMSVRELETAARDANPRWTGPLSPYLDENRQLSKALADALDIVFVNRFGEFGYPEHAISRARGTGSIDELRRVLGQLNGPPPPAESVHRPLGDAPGAPPPWPGSSALSRVRPTDARRWLLRGSALVVACFMAGAAVFATQYGITSITGSARCMSGAAVNQVYVYWGGIIHTGDWAETRTNAADPSIMFFTARVPLGRSYELHVGCGTKPSGGWGVNTSSDTTRANPMHVVCDDTPSGPAGKPPYLGHCT